MDAFSTLPAFLLAVVLIWSAPGPALLLVLRRAAVRGARPAFATVAGLGSGVLVWALVVAAGLGALVAASEVAYVVLRVVGARAARGPAERGRLRARPAR